jgi:hypothetical protein
MSYRKKKQPKQTGLGILRDLKITHNSPPSAPTTTPSNYTPNRFAELEITDERPAYIKAFPEVIELRGYMEEMEMGSGVNVPFHFLATKPATGWDVEAQRELIDKFNYSVRKYGESLNLKNADGTPKRFGTRTISEAGNRHITPSDPAAHIRIIVASPKVPASEAPYKTQNLKLKLRKNVYLYLSQQAKITGEPMTSIAQNLLEEKIKEECEGY